MYIDGLKEFLARVCVGEGGDSAVENFSILRNYW